LEQVEVDYKIYKINFKRVFMKNTEIKIGEKTAMGIEIPLNNVVLIMAVGKK